METAPLKNFATWARQEHIREVTGRIAAVLAPGSSERVEQAKAVAALETAITAGGGGDKGRAAVADKVAYTWFNRIIALRFMDANGYTGTGVVSPQAGVEVGQPEILADAKRGVIDTEVVSQSTRRAVAGLLDGTRTSADPQGEAYALLIVDYCRHWNRSMPFMFERKGDFTELLIPANLLADDSVLNRSVKVLTDDVCKDVEVIGWLYQFYISERKGEVFAGFKKNKKAGADEIPAATQLFTPHWIVRYLVENSLGRLWMLNRPSSRLADQMDYYIAPVDQETDFLKISKPEELTVIDPACGSGHMLTYAFDLLYAIYVEEGYATSDIPALILAHNLYGTEIDPRAGALAAFALTMKARAKQRTFLNKSGKLNVCVIEPISFTQQELEVLHTDDGDREKESAYWNQFAHADVLGALISPDLGQVALGYAAVGGLGDQFDLFTDDLLKRSRRVQHQSDYLAREYAMVIANPPYMGSGNMNGPLAELVKSAFPDEKQDLYACFVSRAYELTRSNGLIAMIVGDTWMTIKTFEAFRAKLLARGGMLTFLHLDDVSNHPDVFGANAAFVLERDGGRDIRCSFIQLEPLSSEEKRLRLKQAVADPESPWVYPVQSSTFTTVPGAPITYRMSEAVRAIFARFPELSAIAHSRQGLATAHDARFLRFWFEVNWSAIGLGIQSRDGARSSGRKWFPFNKGGAFRRWYGNILHVVNWEDDGRELHDFRPRSVLRNRQYYFQPAVSWSNVSSGAPAFRAVDEGVIFGHVGQSIFGNEGVRTELLATLNSQYGHHVLSLVSPTLHFEAGTIARLPINLELDPKHRDLVRELVQTSRQDWDTQETSIGFSRPDWGPATSVRLVEILSTRFEYWTAETERTRALEEQLDYLVLAAYGLEDELESRSVMSRVSLVNNPYFRFDGVDSEAMAQCLFERSSVEDLVSYAVGCMFGRYSLDEDGPILAAQGATLQDYLAKVPAPSFEPDADNVIPVVDGDWFEDDIVARFRQFLRTAFGEEHFEENLRFVSESLGVKNLRDYFLKSFYKDHVQRYKKRPIYWLFSSPKGSFNALIYMHRYTPSTISTVLNEYLREFQAKLKASLEHAERSNKAKEADRLRKILLELDEYEHDVLYPLASQNIAIDLDDGVKTNYPKFGAALKKIVGLEESE
ncbi:BREX-1 system adenine-specific DNA-methyltransferase PglX [Occultella kanbiaonis]|uniref:BREX-1 system adenine-specific DNA-methyltransferase PglX n=1 Tax=Occultella kanbiaonis TaxID=2675754 RepID=UPI0013CFA33C|nr:BREX-1 system adenine-specific DNA-methyltransferase PglX [Occultella kanbiaonis]